jgi:cytochrome oxidase assembly protein ShyY1
VIAVAAIVAVTCVLLGLWQLRRLDDRRERNAAILDRRSAEPIAIEDATPDPDALPHRRATAEGTYDAAHEVLLYGRTLDGASGHHVVTPLLLPGGGAILVDRGWVPFAVQRAPVRIGTPPSTPVTVEGSLLPDEGDGSNRPDAAGVVRRLDVEGIAAGLPYDVYALPLLLSTQSPPQDGPLPTSASPPAPSEGPHLSYAIQWFSFAAIAIAGAVLLLRRDRRRARGSP